jgi:HlyD family secretion protein
LKRALIGIALLAAVAVGVAYIEGREPNDEPAYLTAAVERGKVMTTVTATGTVRAVVTVEVGSQLSGQIDELFVDFNDEVQQGQPIARLDQRTFLAKVREAEAALETAKTTVLIQKAAVERAQSHLSTARARIKVLRAKTVRAQTMLGAAERDLDRMQQLRRKGVAAERQLDEARTERDSAAAERRGAEAEDAVHAQEIKTAVADLHKAEAELLNARATVEQKKATRALARVELERSVIRSPIKGVVIGRDIDRGQTVAASLEAPTLFKIAQDLREMEVHVRIDEADIGRIKLGQKATFRVDAFSNQRFTGRVTQIRKAPEVVKNVVTYTVVATTRNPALQLLPGMTALVRIVDRETKEVLKLPNAALRFRPLGRTNTRRTELPEGSSGANADVWVLGDNGKPKPVRVRLGLSDATATEIMEGPLREGQMVIVGTTPSDGKRRLFGLRLGF